MQRTQKPGWLQDFANAAACFLRSQWPQLVLWVVSLAILFMICFYLPLFKWGIRTGHRVAFQDLGTWLQGVLTPLVIAAAFITWWSQTTSQTEANLIQVRNMILTNVHELYGRLNYEACWVISGGHPPPGSVRYGDLQGVDRLIWLIQHNGNEPKTAFSTALPAVSYDQLTKGPEADRFRSNLTSTVSLINNAQVGFLIDRRIFLLEEVMRNSRLP